MRIAIVSRPPNEFEMRLANRDIGFDGPMRPDHAPTMAGESNDNSGYMVLGRLFAVGYMKGLIQAVNYYPGGLNART
jgi:D-mannonate dehydratase